MTWDKGTALSDDILVAEEIEGYNFEGWYIDEEFTTPYTGDELNGVTTLYAYYTEIIEDETDDELPADDPEVVEPTDEVVDETVVEEVSENPTTGDTIVIFATIFALAIVGLATTLIIRKKLNK